MPTPHFTPELFAFLRRLKKHNSRDWFESHKREYVDHVRDPMLRFIADFAPRLEKISQHFVADPSPSGGSMFRIHRDTRFSKDKSPYKTAATAQFRHEAARDVHAPMFYLHLEPGRVFVGAGIWHPDGPTLAAVRGRIVADVAGWKKATSGAVLKRSFAFAGESLKRPPRGFDPEHPLVEDLKRKDHVVVSEMDEAAAVSPGFLGEFAKRCRTASGYVRWLTGTLDLPF
ncbi:MAG: TIGR02453 family protein [Phycisphaeraceae bacterium]|nr:MAG: TIGR02453 family protein [Phycisphaeraceae bacterium]